MLFNSLSFLVFLPIVLLLHYLVPSKIRWIVLLIASYFFYASWKLEYLVLIVGSTLVDYYAAKKIAHSSSAKTKKFLLVFSLVINLGILFFFKYANFFSVEISKIFGFSVDHSSFFANIILPVGISFYTFQSMSYTIDVYKKRIKPAHHLGYFALYVAYFPQLVAGPIERAGHLLKQFIKPKKVNRIDVYFAITRILVGFIKKVVIADRVAAVVEIIYADPSVQNSTALLLGTILFAIQIYCDFSGYSDIAIGVSRLFGINIMENFRSPYFSKSLGEFWSRWHISLSTWFKDYVYIPLGGNRVVKWKMYYNLLITFILSGFWHGAAWTFIIWGAIHGLGLIIEKRFSFIKLPRLINHLLTLTIVLIGWVFFRANSLNDSWIVIQSLFSLSGYGSIIADGKSLFFGLPFWKFASLGFLVLLTIIIDLLIIKRIRLYKVFSKKPMMAWFTYSLIILFILVFGVFDNNEFIYFQF